MCVEEECMPIILAMAEDEVASQVSSAWLGVCQVEGRQVPMDC